MVTSPADEEARTDRWVFSLPHSGLAWASTGLSILALLWAMSYRETIAFPMLVRTAALPMITAVAALWTGLKAGTSKDERSVFMWAPMMLVGVYLLIAFFGLFM